MKVAIVGGGTGHSQAPLRALGADPNGWECWGQNLYHYTRPFHEYEWDRWFELHPTEWQEGNHPRHMHELRRLRAGEVTLYLQEQDERYPASVSFPKSEVEALTDHGRYHCGTFDWMVALAILEGAHEIALHGMALSTGGEPLAAKACLEYWLGIAEGRGIKVTTEPWSDLFHGLGLHATDRQYGWDWQYRDQHWVPALSSVPDLRELWGYEPDVAELEALDAGIVAAVEDGHRNIGSRLLSALRRGSS